MATDKQRLLDVWIVDLNQVYRDVPYNVVTDWLGQGRLLGEDRVRLAGKPWHSIAKVPAFGPFLPRAEPLRADDQAEALEPVELGLDWKKPEQGDDEDVDMIPLIDISLVLLIFFMMTASVSSGMLSLINTPAARHQLGSVSKDAYWVGIEPKSRSGTEIKGADGKPLPWLSLGMDKKEIVAPTVDPESMLDALEKAVGEVSGEVRIRLRADQGLPIEIIREVTMHLQGREQEINRGRPADRRVVFAISGEVSDPGE